MLILEVNDPKYFCLKSHPPIHHNFIDSNKLWFRSTLAGCFPGSSQESDGALDEFSRRFSNSGGSWGESDPDVKIDARNDGFFQKKGVGSFVKLYSFNI